MILFSIGFHVTHVRASLEQLLLRFHGITPRIILFGMIVADFSMRPM